MRRSTPGRFAVGPMVDTCGAFIVFRLLSPVIALFFTLRQLGKFRSNPARLEVWVCSEFKR
jgi:hypothetical protein